MAPPSQLGNLHKRRFGASPEKFNTGDFQPFQTNAVVTSKKTKTGDDTPYAGPDDYLVPNETKLTVVLGDFDLAPSVKKGSSHKVQLEDEAEPTMRDTRASDLGPLPPSQLTAGFGNLAFTSPAAIGHATDSLGLGIQGSQLTAGFVDSSMTVPKAYEIPLSAIAATPKAIPKAKPKEPFRLIKAFCSDNQLLLLLTSYLTIPSLISLYAIDKLFHHQFNCHYTAQILAIMRTWAPNSDMIYPWRAYKKLCTKDPKLRQTSRLKGKESKQDYSDVRDVPSIRWLQMVVYRHAVCEDMLLRLASYGHRCPAGTCDTIKRLWFLLDLPTNPQRILAIHSKIYFTNRTLYYITQFLIKLDMHLTHPLGAVNPPNHPDTFRFPPIFANKGFVGCQLRETLMGERSLTPLWRLLRGWSPDVTKPAVPPDMLDLLKLWVRHHYEPATEEESDDWDEEEGSLDPRWKQMDVMDVPWFQIGRAQTERIGEAYRVADDNILRDLLAAEKAESKAEDEANKTADKSSTSSQSQNPANINTTQHSQDAFFPPSVLRSTVNPMRTVIPPNRRTEILLRPDELVMREGVRRELKLWDHWTRMMVWGWFDPAGRPVPILTMEEMMTVRNGRPLFARPPGKGENGALLRKLEDGRVVLREGVGVKGKTGGESKERGEEMGSGEGEKSGGDKAGGDKAGGEEKIGLGGGDGGAAETVGEDKTTGELEGDDYSGKEGDG